MNKYFIILSLILLNLIILYFYHSIRHIENYLDDTSSKLNENFDRILSIQNLLKTEIDKLKQSNPDNQSA